MSSCSGDQSLGYEDAPDVTPRSPISLPPESGDEGVEEGEDSSAEAEQEVARRLSQHSEEHGGSPEEEKLPEVPEPQTPVNNFAPSEMTIKMAKAPAEPLGVAVEAEAGGYGGALLTAVLPGGAAHRDGRLLVGAELLALNHENLRRASQAQTSAILRRASLLSAQVSVTFVPPPPPPLPPPSAFAPPPLTAPPPPSRVAVTPPTTVESTELGASHTPAIPSSLPGITSRQVPVSLTSPRCFPDYYRSPFVPPSPVDTSSSTGDRGGHAVVCLPPPLKTDSEEEEGCVTVISVSHGATDPADDDEAPPDSPPPLPPQEEPSPHDITTSLSRTEILIGESPRSRTEILIGGEEDIDLVQTVRVSTDCTVPEPQLRPNTETMTVTQSMQGASKTSPPMMSKHWGPERLVQVLREPNCSLGISIVGGKVDLYNAGPDSGSAISGIFIKNVLPQSPAGRTGELKTGDRILEVDCINLRTASHERAVDVIRAAGNPVRFLVQSLIQWNVDGGDSEPPSTSSTPTGHRSFKKGAPPPVPLSVTPFPVLIQEGTDDFVKQGHGEKIRRQNSRPTRDEENDDEQTPTPSPPPGDVGGENKYSSDEESEEEEDVRDLEGKITTKKGQEIYRASAGNVKRTPEEIAADPEEEDDYGYTANKVKKKYGGLKGSVLVAALERGPNGLGVSLAGHKDRTRMAVFVCGLNPNGIAYREGSLKVGDEILEVNGVVVQGRCHLNASAIIKGLAGPVFKVIVLRRETAIQELAVKPITQFPVSLDDETPEERYAKFKGLKTVTIKKGNQGLGIMIIEGKHAEVGQGIFISDLQEGSAAEQAGLCVGEMILQVNKDSILGQSYDAAAQLLKKSEGVVTLVVCNPNKKDDSGAPGAPGAAAAEPEKPRLSPAPSNSTITSPSSLPVKPSHLPVTTPSRSPSISSASTLPTPSPLRPSAMTPLTLTTTPRPKSPAMRTDEPPAPPADPATCPINPGRETTIEVNKDKMGLGLSIVGGSDTLLSAIIIHEVYPDGAAAKDGRLRPGDQILEVNSEDFRSTSHTKALAVLRQTPVKVKMVVLREETAKEEDRYDALDVELVKKPGKGLGLSIVGRKNGTGVFISDVVHGGTAEADGRLMKGDQILSVNGQDLKSASQEEAAAVLKTVAGKVTMKLGRLKAARKAAANGTDKLEPEEPPLDRLTPPPIPPLPSACAMANAAAPLACREVRLARGPDGLGFSIVGGHGSPHGDLPIYVKTVFDSGAAASSGALRRGDQIIAVDGTSLEGLTHQAAVAVLKHASNPVVTLTIKP